MDSPTTLRTYLMSMFRTYFLRGWLAILGFALIAFLVQRHIQQRSTIERSLRVSAETVERALTAGDWDLALRHIQVTLESNGLYRVIVNDEHKRAVLGPIGKEPFGLGWICRSVKQNSSFEVSGCGRILRLEDMVFIVVCFLLFSLPVIAFHKLVKAHGNQLIALIEHEISDLSSTSSGDPALKKSKFVELEPIRQMTIAMLQNTKAASAAEATAELANQVSHDIRSPLSALMMTISTIKDLPEDKRSVINSACKRISEISQELLTHTKQQVDLRPNIQLETPTELRTEVRTLLERIIAEKKHEYAGRAEIVIKADLASSEDSYATINGTTLSRIISNLINNSVEAIQTSGTVSIGLRIYKTKICVSVSDNGKGIPAEIVEKLGKTKFTFGKMGTQSGSGLGLHHARKAILETGGTLNIQSREGEGTLITLTIPRQAEK